MSKYAMLEPLPAHLRVAEVHLIRAIAALIEVRSESIRADGPWDSTKEQAHTCDLHRLRQCVAEIRAMRMRAMSVGHRKPTLSVSPNKNNVLPDKTGK